MLSLLHSPETLGITQKQKGSLAVLGLYKEEEDVLLCEEEVLVHALVVGNGVRLSIGKGRSFLAFLVSSFGSLSDIKLFLSA